MIVKFHPSLTAERWRSLGWDKRILNIASELARAKAWIHENHPGYAKQSIERALELVDLTVEAGPEGKTPGFMRELLRFRECLAGFYDTPSRGYQEFVTLMEGFLDLDPAVHNLHLEI